MGIKKFWLLLTMTALVLCSCQWSTPSLSLPTISQTQSSFSVDLKQKGVSWVGGRQPVKREDFSSLIENHVNWIVQTPFGWQQDYDSPELMLKTHGVYWGETDEGLVTTTQMAQSLGIQTLLKPHIWLLNPSDGKWRTEIEMRSERDWQAWFSNYRKFILHYAQFAEQQGIQALCIGTELQTTAVQREEDWRQLIQAIRQVYSGKLTYAANWYQAFEDIQFWDELDFIGIQAYFPLTDKTNPTLAELKQGWRSHLGSIERVQSRYQKPVIFTEWGYRSAEDAAIEPWKWPEEPELRSRKQATEKGLKTQADCYEAFFQTVWSKDWFAGAYVWKWFPKIHSDQKLAGPGFTPQNKPAEKVLRRWYQQQVRLPV